MSRGPDLSGIISASPRALPKGLVVKCLAIIFLGVFGAHWSFAQWPDRAMAAFLTCIVYFLGMCQGGFMFAVSLTLTQGRWGRPLKRIAECFLVMVPVIYVGLISFLLLGGMDIFPWTTEPMPPPQGDLAEPYVLPDPTGLRLAVHHVALAGLPTRELASRPWHDAAEAWKRCS